MGVAVSAHPLLWIQFVLVDDQAGYLLSFGHRSADLDGPITQFSSWVGNWLFFGMPQSKKCPNSAMIAGVCDVILCDIWWQGPCHPYKSWRFFDLIVKEKSRNKNVWCKKSSSSFAALDEIPRVSFKSMVATDNDRTNVATLLTVLVALLLVTGFS